MTLIPLIRLQPALPFSVIDSSLTDCLRPSLGCSNYCPASGCSVAAVSTISMETSAACSICFQ